MFRSINPYTEKIVYENPEITDEELEKRLDLAFRTFLKWRNISLDERKNFLSKLIEILTTFRSNLAYLITSEMGKTIKESESEVDKCIKLIRYYVDNIDKYISDEFIDDGKKIIYESLGPIFAIMPWNFPFWQVFRFVVPNLLAGNTVVLKHASNVQESAKVIEFIFDNIGFGSGLLVNLPISSVRVERGISDQRIFGVTLTGSENAGRSVARLAGEYIKKVVLELGGNDPFIVFEDVDLDFVLDNAAKARLRNAGQACNSAKRFLVHQKIFNQFVDGLRARFASVKVGDPLDRNTDMGPVVAESAREQILEQIEIAKNNGAEVTWGGRKLHNQGYFVEPTIVSNVSQNNPVLDQEIFGPVALVISFRDYAEAIELANKTSFGLNSSVWTNNKEYQEYAIKNIQAGSVFINQIATSDVMMPFGGIKKSGFGREMGESGVREFLNIKSVVYNND